MLEITIHRPDADDFSGSGLGYLRPLDCTVSEALNGMYELEIVMSLNDPMSALIGMGSVIVAPVPAAETPELALTAVDTQTTQRLIYRVSTSGSNLHMRSGPGTSYKILRKYKNGTEVVVLDRSNSSWYRVAAPDGAGGWMSAKWLTYVRTDTVVSSGGAQTEVVAPKPVRAQPFRVHKIVPGLLTVSFSARHVFYDLSDNMVLPCKLTGTRQTIARALLTSCMDGDHGFTAYCGGAAAGTLALDNPVSPIEAIAGTDGLVDVMGGEIMRDWYDLYVVDRLGRNRGVSVRYGRNLISVGGSICSDNAATRIVPIGRDKEGSDLYLPEKFIEAENAAEWPHPRYAVLRVDDAEVGEDMTQAQAYARLRAAAAEAFDQGAARADASITVDFVELAQTVDAADAAKLQKLFLGDDVLVEITPMGMRTTMRMVSYIYDCLRRQYRKMTLGSAGADIASVGISPRQLPDAGVTASKLANAAVQARNLADGVVGSAKIAMAAIDIAHINQAAIDQLNANAITAVTGRFGSISADEIETDELYAAVAHVVALAADSIRAGKIDVDALAAALAEIVVLRAETIQAENITTDELAAAVARIVALRADTITAGSIETDELGAALAKVIALYAQVGDFDFVASKNLVSGALSVEEASADSVYITNLAVTNANLLSATLGKLVLKGEDGKYYEIVVGADGQISTQEVTVSEGEIAAGETAGGRQIVETSANIGDLNAQNIKGNQAIINTILTTALTAEKITAADAMIASATIPALYATSIQAIGSSLDLRANESVKLAVGDAVDGVDERINGVYSEVTQRADGLEAQLIEKVDGETLRAYIRYDGENVEIGRSDSRYRTQTSDRGFVILQDGAEMTSMEQNAVTAPVFRARRTIEIGGHVMKLGSAGHLIIN